MHDQTMKIFIIYSVIIFENSFKKYFLRTVFEFFLKYFVEQKLFENLKYFKPIFNIFKYV